ncbi:hypothetical protein A3F60_02195, partial [Candidatus Roizmanbacteria bacterium RIFCSPHIGHO2_12_FULL_39_8]
MKKLFELINKNLFSNIFQKKVSWLDPQDLPIITISREKGSGGRPIAHLIAKKLGRPWKVYHEAIVDEISKETHLRKDLIKELDERNIPLIDEMIAEFFGTRYLNMGNYYKHLIKTLTTIGHRGYAVIVGRGAQHLFPHALKVRVICEWDQRIAWMMEFEKVSRSEAVKRIEKSDIERYEFEQSIFKHDIKKAQHYNFIIRTGKTVSIEDAANTIV